MNRIKAIVSKIKFNNIADIGTDHGYISIQSYLDNNNRNIIASDINELPLQNCIDNLIKYGLQQKIKTRISNGLLGFDTNDAETIIIAGMGGKLIVDILNNNLCVTKSAKQLILQPQLDMCLVRKFVHKIGFEILEEDIVFEDNKYYFIINCINQKENLCANFYTEDEYVTGKKINQIDLAIKYYSDEKKYLMQIKNKILTNGTNISKQLEKIKSLDNQIAVLEKFILN